jgi:hypothetical protein
MTVTLAQASAKTPPNLDKPEIELLLCCARTKVNSKTAAQIKTLVEQEINWNYLLEIASAHELIALLYHNLNTICPEVVPPAILNQLKNYFETTAQKNLLITAELLKILNLFKTNNIVAIPFKGATLAAFIYGNLAFRQFCDLDILVDERDVPKITELLVSIGYQLPAPLDAAKEQSYFQYKQFLESKEFQKKYDFIHGKKKIAIDLQWSLTENRISRFFPVDLKHFQKNAKLVSLGGVEVLQFSSEDMLLYLCFHGSKHCWTSLKWICDVAELIQSQPEINWERVQQQARKWGCDRMLYLGLLLARDLLEINLPEQLNQTIETDKISKVLAEQVKKNLFVKQLTETEKYLFIFRSRKGLLDKFHYLFHILFTPTAKEWHFLPLPQSLSFLYYFIRPLRLLLEYRNRGKLYKVKFN